MMYSKFDATAVLLYHSWNLCFGFSSDFVGSHSQSLYGYRAVVPHSTVPQHSMFFCVSFFLLFRNGSERMFVSRKDKSR